MAAHSAQPGSSEPAGASSASYEERLERCEIVYFPTCPFAIPEGGDRRFLLEQELASNAHKNISYDPHTGRANGFRRRSDDQSVRVRDLLASFSRNATGWLADALPHHAQGWQLDRVSFRPEEEATRQVRQTARNDLLHVDSFPSRPTQGHRILRCFVNLNLSEPRIWVTSDPFAQLLERYGRDVGLPGKSGLGLGTRLRNSLVRLFRPGKADRSVYDAFMLKFHHFMKNNDDFQEHCHKRYWTFAPGSMWMVFTDAVSHAALRGRYAMEHSYFVSPQALLHPELSPPAVLARACGAPVLPVAA